MANLRTRTSRRTFLKAGTAAAAFAVSTPYVVTPSRAQSKELIVNTWGGSWTAAENEALFKPFTEGGQQQPRGDESHQRVAHGHDPESGEVVVFVVVPQAGEHAQEGGDLVAVHFLPCIEQLLHGNPSSFLTWQVATASTARQEADWRRAMR